MAGGFKDFTAATAVSADVDNYLMRQSIMRFATVAARDAALASFLEDGEFAITLDTHSIWYYNLATTAWVPVSTPWTSYTPAWTHLTIGNATVNAAYRYVAGDFRIRGRVVCGTTTSGDGTNILQTIPNSVTSDSSIGARGSGALYDTSAPRSYPMICQVSPSDTAIEWVQPETGVNGQFASPGGPVTLGTGDVFTWDITVPTA
jgi:hypothetical protein